MKMIFRNKVFTMYLKNIVILYLFKQWLVLSLMSFSPKGGKPPEKYNAFYIPERFNTNILHQFFDYTITFVNQQH